MNSELKIKYKIFLKKFYPLNQSKIKITKPDLLKLNRGIWYCNCSSFIIPELQRFNSKQNNIKKLNDNSNKNELSLSEQYYNKGYNNYRTYLCGHAIIDIHYLSIIFDYVNSNFCHMIKLRQQGGIHINEYVINQIANISTTCPICCNENNSRIDMYKIDNRFVTGSVILRNIIPKKYLDQIMYEFTNGSIVDTEGYRGTGLYLLDDKKWIALELDEYYPIWNYDLLKKYGYVMLLANCSTNVNNFDKLEFFNDIYLLNNNYTINDNNTTCTINNCDGFYSTKLDKIMKEQNDWKISNYIIDSKYYLKKNDNLLLKFKNKVVTFIKDKMDDHYIIPTPIKSVNLLNIIFNSGFKFKVQISKFDYLYFFNQIIAIKKI